MAIDRVGQLKGTGTIELGTKTYIALFYSISIYNVVQKC